MDKINIRPLFDNVIIEPLEKEETTQGGIIIPDIAKEKPCIGRVVAVGPGKLDESRSCVVSNSGSGGGYPTYGMFVAVGQKVMYKKWGGNEVKVNGKEMVIVEQKDILAIVE